MLAIVEMGAGGVGLVRGATLVDVGGVGWAFEQARLCRIVARAAVLQVRVWTGAEKATQQVVGHGVGGVCGRWCGVVGVLT